MGPFFLQLPTRFLTRLGPGKRFGGVRPSAEADCEQFAGFCHALKVSIAGLFVWHFARMRSRQFVFV